MKTADRIIKKLKLKPHPREGGYFFETYRLKYKNNSVSTAIYFLLTPETFSAMHKLDKDEIFHFYAGGPVEMLLLFPDGTGKTVVLGSDILNGMAPQVVVKKNVCQGSRLVKGRFALLGTTMAPGFEYKYYHDCEKQALIKKYPKFKNIINVLTR